MSTPSGDDTDYPAHELADLFPAMDPASLDTLTEDIRDHGLREPITLFQKKVLDGRHRLAACRKCGVSPGFVEYDGNDPLGFVVSKNLRRRHMDESQRSMVAGRLSKLKPGSNQHTVVAEISATTQARAAALLNVSRGSVQNAGTVLEKGVPELAAAVDSGEVSVSAAAQLAKRPKEEQKKALKGGKKGVRAAAKKARTAKKPVQPPADPDPGVTAFVDRVEGVCQALDRLKADVAELAADPLGRHIHADSVTHAIAEARKALWQSRPTEPCDQCADGEPQAECRACYGTGRTTAARLQKKGGE